MKLFNLLILIFFLTLLPLKADEDFNQWLSSYKKYAKSKGVSQETINIAFKNVIFLKLSNDLMLETKKLQVE